MSAAEKFLAALFVGAIGFAGVALVNISLEAPRFVEWCEAQGGEVPHGTHSDPTCIRDGLVLIAPADRDARWPS